MRKLLAPYLLPLLLVTPCILLQQGFTGQVRECRRLQASLHLTIAQVSEARNEGNGYASGINCPVDGTSLLVWSTPEGRYTGTSCVMHGSN